MKWQKKGLIYGPDGRYKWAKHSALTPTPILKDDQTIRVYAGFRDEKGVSRIGYVDVDADNPSHVQSVSKEPVLDIGLPGTFDDNGLILGDVLQHEQKLYMYYVGFQLVEKVKFLAFTGLAISLDGGDSFKRYSNIPVLDRSYDSLYIKAVHSVIAEDGKWKTWYASGSDWQVINNRPYPKYNIKYTESADGMRFHEKGRLCIEAHEPEYRVGRPRVYKEDDLYRMFYTKGDTQGNYLPGYAESEDGVNWVRKDGNLGITLSNSGWDSKSLCYPALITCKKKKYMFYNGNDMGRDGFGYAVLT